MSYWGDALTFTAVSTGTTLTFTASPTVSITLEAEQDQLVLEASDIQMTGPVTFGDRIIGGQIDISGAADFNSTVTFDGAVTTNSTVTLNTGAFTINSVAEFNGVVNFDSTVDFDGAVDFSAAITASSTFVSTSTGEFGTEVRSARSATQFLALRSNYSADGINKFLSISAEGNKKDLFIDNVHDGTGTPSGTLNIYLRAGGTVASPTSNIILLDTGRVRFAGITSYLEFTAAQTTGTRTTAAGYITVSIGGTTRYIPTYSS